MCCGRAENLRKPENFQRWPCKLPARCKCFQIGGRFSNPPGGQECPPSTMLLGDEAIGQFVFIVGLAGKVGGEDLTAAFDRVAKRIARVA